MTYNNKLSAAKLNLVWWEILLIVIGIKCFIAIILGCRNRNFNESISEDSNEVVY